MKQIISILLAGLLMISLVACNKAVHDENNPGETEEQASTDESKEESSSEADSEKKIEIPPAPASEDEPKLPTEEDKESQEEEWRPAIPNPDKAEQAPTPGMSEETATPPEAASQDLAPSTETPNTTAPASPETPFPELTTPTPPETATPNQEKTSAMTIGYAGMMDDGKTKVYIAMDDAVETMAIVFLDADNALNISLIGEVTESTERQCLVVTDEAQQVSLDFAPTFNNDRTVTMDFGTMGNATITPMEVKEVLAIISQAVSSTKSAIS